MQIKQTHRVILKFLLYSIFRGKYMINKKVFLSILLLSALLLSNPIKAIEDNNGYVGLRMYKFPKPRIAKEVTVIEVIPNSPAWKAGIRIADRILKVNDIDVSNYNVEQVHNLIKGKPQEKVKVTLLTRDGIKDFILTRESFNPDKIDHYPRWLDMCGDKKLGGETCFYHPGTYKSKFSDNFKFSGPVDVMVFGAQKAAIRYQYEDDLRICQNAKDRAMCYMVIKQSINNRNYAQAQLQQQATQNMIQNFNHLNTNLELQNMNQNLYNINNNLQMLRY